MARSKFSSPDQFAVAPLLTLLPRLGSVSRLEPLSASLYARYEKVTNLVQDLEPGSSSELRKRLLAEQGMLRQVLDWLAIQPGSDLKE